MRTGTAMQIKQKKKQKRLKTEQNLSGLKFNKRAKQQ